MSVITKRPLQPDPVGHHRAELGEGPVWDATLSRLVWVDIPGRQILTTDPTDGSTESITTPTEVGAVALTDTDDYVAALEDGIYTGNGVEPWQLIAAIEASDPTTRMNDGKCDPHGAFVGGTIARDLTEGAASLYRVNNSGVSERLLDNITISNGLDWSDDGATLFYIDTSTRTVMGYPYDHRSPVLGNPTPVVEIPAARGHPDGMTLDSEGCLWIGLWGGHAVHRYTPSGVLDTIIELPVTNVTSCAFGGSDLGTLFITTASTRDGTTEEPLAGALFAVRVGVSGRLPNRFRTRGSQP